MKNNDSHYHHSPTAREMILIRWIVGLLGLAMFVFVLAELATGSFSYAIGARWGRGPRFDITGHATTRSPAGLLFAFGSFGMMGAGSLAFALKPSLFKNEAVIWALVAVILVSFIGLRIVAG